jgi:dolichol-phosphate mannosyltransferase
MLSIVVPCFNEADNAPTVERDLLPVARGLATDGPVEIVFVDDGSSDDTLAVFEALCARHAGPQLLLRVVPHDRNRGLGAALRTGLRAAHGDVLVTTDCDATYRFHEIPKLLARLTPDVDVVTASPYHPEGHVENVPQHRLVLSKGSSALYRLLVDRRVHCYTALFRAYRRRVLQSARLSSDGFLAGTEILVNAMLAGHRVVEHPCTLHSRVMGTSKAKLLRTIKAHLRFQARLLGVRLGLSSTPWVAERPSVAAPVLGEPPAPPAAAAATAPGVSGVAR